MITKEEHESQALALAAGVKFLPSHHLVPFEVLESKSSDTSSCDRHALVQLHHQLHSELKELSR